MSGLAATVSAWCYGMLSLINDVPLFLESPFGINSHRTGMTHD